MESSRKSIQIKKSDSLVDAELEIVECDDDTIKLIVRADDVYLDGESYNCFDALADLRSKAETLGILILCHGASLNVYPSGMSKSMGIGVMAYKMTLGKQALRSDLVNIFEVDDSYIASTVEEQKAYFKKWIASLG